MITKNALPNKENVTYKMFHSSIWQSVSDIFQLLFYYYMNLGYASILLRVKSKQKNDAKYGSGEWINSLGRGWGGGVTSTQ